MCNLTGQQREVFIAILKHVEYAGTYPTCREIMVAMGFKSTNSVAGHVKALIKKGKLTRLSNCKSRQLVVPEIQIAVNSAVNDYLKRMEKTDGDAQPDAVVNRVTV